MVWIEIFVSTIERIKKRCVRRRCTATRYMLQSVLTGQGRTLYCLAKDSSVSRKLVSMKVSNVLIWLSWLVVVLALVAAGTGLFGQNGGSPFTFTSLRGQSVQIYGHGLYRYDTLFTGAANRGNDAVTLMLGIPLLIVSTLLYRRGSLRGGLLLMGTLVYFLYLYASYGLGTAFNRLFLVYIALFSASLFAFVLIFTSLDRQVLAARFTSGLPRRGVAIFMFASGLVTLVVWLQPLLGALLRDAPPPLLGSYTTNITDVLDLGIITPATFIAGGLILRRDPLGYLVACALLVLEIMLAPMITAQTVSQLLAGVTFTTGAIMGPIAGFMVLALAAIWVLVTLLRALSDSTPAHQVSLQAVHA
jgi:hypothetical protein